MDQVKQIRNRLGKSPKDPDLLTEYGRLCLQNGDIWSARAAFRKANEFAPGVVEFLNNLAVVELKTGRPDLALELIIDSRNRSPRDAGSVKIHYETLMALGQSGQARAVLEKVKTQGLNTAEVDLDLAETFVAEGLFSQAAEIYKRLMTAAAPSAGAFWGMAQLPKQTFSASWWETLQSLIDNPSTSRSQLLRLLKARAILHDRQGQFEAAMQCHSMSNRMQHQVSVTNTHGYPALDAVIAHPNVTPPSSRVQSDRPIFVIGMPRSGTTLVEQILASHPDVHGAGELTFFRLQAQRQRSKALGNRDTQDIANAYLDLLSAHHPTAKHVVDKMPSNFENVWLIHACLPNARIIHCRRDPMATCTSLFTSPMGGAHRYLGDLKTLGEKFLWYEELMQVWANRHPNRFYDLTYEKLVADPEKQVRGLLDHLGLEWNDRCMQFWKTLRPVQTPSRADVARPIHLEGLSKWRRYEPFLDPLTETLSARY
jgi:tetratricopeptide (TPR) repeat protein